jgi:hypothetical protein
MLRSLTIVSILAAAVVAAACDPFSPELSDTPYRCASVEPKCPDGYEAVEVGQPNLCECHKTGAAPGMADAGPSDMCSDNGTEPNDLFTNARNTPIGTGAMTAEFPNQSICTALDVDTFKINCSQAMQKITATLQFNPAVGQLSLRIVDQNGERIDPGTPMMQGNSLVTSAKMPTTGRYYVQVGSSSGINTYGLTLALTN